MREACFCGRSGELEDRAGNRYSIREATGYFVAPPAATSTTWGG